MIPRIYCITLPETPERQREASKHFQERGVDVEWVRGIHGHGFGLKAAHPAQELNVSRDWRIHPNHLGLVVSHHIVWTLFEHSGYEECIVLEDDACFPVDWKRRFLEHKQALPSDWQWVTLGSIGWEENMRQNWERVNNLTCASRGCATGTHAYMIKRSVLPILHHTQWIARDHIDNQLGWRTYSRCKHYVFYPNLIEQYSINNQKPDVFKLGQICTVPEIKDKLTGEVLYPAQDFP